MKRFASLFINTGVILFGTIGLYYTIKSSDFMSDGVLLYYTVQSNMLAMAVAAVALYYEHRKLKGAVIPPVVYLIRHIACVAITLTFLVFSIMLSPVIVMQGNISYLGTPGNLCLHNLVPLCCIADWCLHGSMRGIKPKLKYLGLLPAFLYVVFTLARALNGLGVGKNLVPYFFLDFEKYGWLRINSLGIGVIWWILIIALTLVVLCRLGARLAARNDNKIVS